MTQGTTAVIGCGNPNRRDDGVGPRVIEKLRSHTLPETVALYDAGTDGMSVMYQARGASRLIIVDAKSPEGSPGAIFEVPGDVLETAPSQSLNLHDFRWDHALYAGKKIYRDDFPKDVAVLLIEAQDLSLGLDLTEPVESAANVVATRILKLVLQPEAITS